MNMGSGLIDCPVWSVSEIFMLLFLVTAALFRYKARHSRFGSCLIVPYNKMHCAVEAE